MLASAEQRMDDARPVQRVINGEISFDIGIQYLPGDDRFGKILAMGYGHLRNTRGDDDMALDCYVHPLVVSGEVAPYDRPLFAIAQLDDDGEYDELKIMIGWRSANDAERAYLKVMPEKKFGSIEEIEIDDLEEYATETEAPFEAVEEDEDEGVFDEEDREDAFPLVKRRWKIGGHQIEATHQPGDQRFNYSLPMSSYYGYMKGTYGQGDDGKAYDFYIHPDCPDCEEGENKPPLYAIVQVTPDGQPDETKFMMGYASAQQARDTYINHAGRDRFGLIQPIEWDEFADVEQNSPHSPTSR